MVNGEISLEDRLGSREKWMGYPTEFITTMLIVSNSRPGDKKMIRLKLCT
jgi:hypothetical protein